MTIDETKVKFEYFEWLPKNAFTSPSPQKHLWRAVMVMFFRPTTHKETDR